MRRASAAILLIGFWAAAPSAAADIDSETGLIRAPGWEQVRIHCGSCHSHKLVTAQRADRRTWLGIIRWMQETQNLWQFEPATEEAILDYLAANYPPRPDRRRAAIPPHLMPPPTASPGASR
ncbi:MAG TPA: hypothetical protein VJ883_01535 [Woeseiaceae bacterium]|nr:hypothetical protein [Woeseiaceae bacterium]